MKSFGKHGIMPGEFSGPEWLAVDDYGMLSVCDTHNNRVEIFIE